MAKYTIEVSDEVEKALGKVAQKEGTTKQEIVEKQLNYYISCALYSYMGDVPFNCSKMSIKERLETYASYIKEKEKS